MFRLEGEFLVARSIWEPDSSSSQGSDHVTSHVEVWAGPPFFLSGVVEDEAGHPVRGVSVASGKIKTLDDGKFTVGPFAEDPAQFGRTLPADTWLGVSFGARGFAAATLDPYSIPLEDRQRLRIRLRKGVMLGGTVVDTRETPLEGVDIEVQGDLIGFRGITDVHGQWRITHLNPVRIMVIARAFQHDAIGRRELVLHGDDLGVRIVAEPIHLPRSVRKIAFLGMTLVEADDVVRAAYELPTDAAVVVVDAGPFDRTRHPDLGGLWRGHELQTIDGHPIGSLLDLVDYVIKADARGAELIGSGSGAYGRIQLAPTSEQLVELRRIRAELTR